MPLAHEQEALIVFGEQLGVAVRFVDLLFSPQEVCHLHAITQRMAGKSPALNFHVILLHTPINRCARFSARKN